MMLSTLAVRLGQMRLFWLLRASLRNAKFWRDKNLYGFGKSIKDKTTFAQTFLDLLKSVLSEIVLGFLIVVALQYLNELAAPTIASFGFSALTNGEYESLLVAVIALGGVFIGLYYTATSAIAGIAYSQAPSQIRTMFATERYGQVYMRFVARATFVSTVVLLFFVLGFPQITIALPFIVASAGLSIAAFVNLGSAAFHLFDPTSLTVYPLERLRQYVRQMTVGKYKWSDESFQQHVHNLAVREISALNAISKMAVGQPHLAGTPYANFCNSLIGFLCWYEPRKRRIPKNSRWFQQLPVHPDWYNTSDSTTSIVHETGSILQPESTSKDDWIEERLLKIVWEYISKNVDSDQFGVVLNTVAYINIYVETLAAEHLVEKALKVTNDTFSACETFLLEAENSATNIERKIALTDNIAQLPITILLTYLTAIQKLDRDHIHTVCKEANWANTEQVHATNLPSFTRDIVEWLFQRISFEVSTEGRIVTPAWYSAEQIGLSVCKKAQDAINLLYKDSYELYFEWVKKCEGRNQEWVNASILSRTHEYTSKAAHHKDSLLECWDHLYQTRRIGELPWPPPNTQTIEKNFATNRKFVMQKMATLAALLVFAQRSENIPDFGGKFLHATAESVLESLFDNDIQFVSENFQLFHIASMQKFDLMRPKADGEISRREYELKLALSPLIDLLEISGIAFFLSEFHETPELFSPIKSAWDEYFENKHTQKQLAVKSIGAGVALTESAFELAHRSVLRTGWGLKLKALVGTLKTSTHLSGREFFHSEEIAIHESALVRLFSKSSYSSMYDGIDLFIFGYLKNVDGFEISDFGRMRRRDLEMAISREMERRNPRANLHHDN